MLSGDPTRGRSAAVHIFSVVLVHETGVVDNF